MGRKSTETERILQVKFLVRSTGDGSPPPDLHGHGQRQTWRRERDDDALADTTGEELLDRLISDEMGEKIAQIMRSARRAQEAWHRSAQPRRGAARAQAAR